MQLDISSWVPLISVLNWEQIELYTSLLIKTSELKERNVKHLNMSATFVRKRLYPDLRSIRLQHEINILRVQKSSAYLKEQSREDLAQESADLHKDH